MADITRIKRPRRKFTVGQMDQRIAIQERNLALNMPGNTEVAVAFGNAREVWASIRTYRPNQFFDGVNLEVKTTHIIYIRYLPGVTKEQSIVWRDQIFDIDDVENLDEANQYLKISCHLRGHEEIPVNLG